MRTLLLLLLFSFHSAIALATPSPVPVTPGFYNNAQGSPVIPLIRSARKTIDIEIYTMYDRNVRDAIREALARDVSVRIIQEPKPDGDACKPFAAASSKDDADCADTKKLVADVRNAGGAYTPYNKQALCPSPKSACYQHGKLLLVDSATAMFSTGNYDATSLCDLGLKPGKCDRDYSFVDEDADVVAALETIFANDLKGESYDLSAIVSGPVAEKITVSPLSLAPLVKLIQSATSTIDLENQYLNQEDLNTALETAAQSGVTVSVTVASACAFGKPSASAAKKDTAIYSAFDAAGISSRMLSEQAKIDGTPGYLHAKAMVIDGKRAWLGSVNGSNSATSNNREFGVFFDDPQWVSALQEQIVEDHGSPGSETWKQSLACELDRG